MVLVMEGTRSPDSTFVQVFIWSGDDDDDDDDDDAYGWRA